METNGTALFAFRQYHLEAEGKSRPPLPGLFPREPAMAEDDPPKPSGPPPRQADEEFAALLGKKKPVPGAPRERLGRRPSPLGLMGEPEPEPPKASGLPSPRAVLIMVGFSLLVILLAFLFSAR